VKAIAFLLAAILPLSWGLPPALRLTWTLAVFACLGTSLALGRARLGPGAGPWLLASLLAAGSTFISAANAEDPNGHFQVGVLIVSMWCVGTITLRWIAAERPETLAWLASGLATGQSASAVVAVAQVFTGASVFGAEATLGRAPGLSGHSNVLGLMCAVTILGAVAVGWRSGRRVIAASVIVLNLAGLLASASLTAAGALAVGALIMAVVSRVRVRRLLLMSGAVVLAAYLVLALAPSEATIRSPGERLAQITGQTSAISTLDTRVHTWAAALAGIKRDGLIGVGLDDTSGVTWIALDGETLTHNLILRAWYQGGMAMVLAVLIIYASVLAAVVRAIRLRVAALEAGALGAMFVFALTSATLQQPYFWLVAIAAHASLWEKVVERKNLAMTTSHHRPAIGPLMPARLT